MTGIVAVSSNRVIGNGGKIPWKNKDDMKFFKDNTLGKNLIMGRKTFDSVGLLSDRKIFVLTDNRKLHGKVIEDWDKNAYAEYLNRTNLILDRGDLFSSNTWVCGGSEIYNYFLPFIETFYVTYIQQIVKGDTYMPLFEHMFSKMEVITVSKVSDYSIVKYTK